MRYSSLFLILALSCLSCTEYFTPDINEKSPMVVVDGLITEDYEKCIVKVSYTQNYNEQLQFCAVEGANVLVFQNNDSFPMTEVEPGIYKQLNSAFKGNINDNLVLSIETLDGLKIISDNCTMLPAPGIDSIYFEYVEEEELYQNSKGDYNSRKVNKYHFSYDLENYDTTNYYFTLRRKAIIHSDEFRNTTYSLCWDIWYDYQTDIPLYINNLNNLSGRKVKQDHIFSISQKKFEDIANLHPRGITLIVEQYSLDKDAYVYYQQISEQIYADGRFFDPIETQIEGNMRCKNNSDVIVLGYFRASSVNEYRFYVEKMGGDQFFTKSVNDRTQVESAGCIENETPSFWSAEWLDQFGPF